MAKHEVFHACSQQVCNTRNLEGPEKCQHSPALKSAETATVVIGLVPTPSMNFQQPPPETVAGILCAVMHRMRPQT